MIDLQMLDDVLDEVSMSHPLWDYAYAYSKLMRSEKFKIIPVEPTELLIQAMEIGYNYDGLEDETWTRGSNDMEQCYNAMIAAAPPYTGEDE